MKIYLAAPLFNEMERSRNLAFAKKLNHNGFDVFLPQRDAGEIDKGAGAQRVFEQDVEGIDNCDWLVALCDGRTQDEGMCWEIGYAYAKAKNICIVYDDTRRFSTECMLNNMLMGSATLFCQSLEDAIGCIKSFHEMPE